MGCADLNFICESCVHERVYEIQNLNDHMNIVT